MNMVIFGVLLALKFVGLLILNWGLHVFWNQIPFNFWGDLLIFVGLSAMIFKVSLDIKKR